MNNGIDILNATTKLIGLETISFDEADILQLLSDGVIGSSCSSSAHADDLDVWIAERHRLNEVISDVAIATCDENSLDLTH